MNVEQPKRQTGNGCCIGCGVCSAAEASHPRVPPEASPSIVEAVCPFSKYASNEDEIAKVSFPDCDHESRFLGRYVGLYAGYVAEGDARSQGSSGGIGRWLLSELLLRKKVDKVVQVVSANPAIDGALYKYAIARDPEEAMHAAKSAYYPVTLADVLQEIMATEDRYVVTGVPCFLKAISLLARHDERIRERIVYKLGLVCGHLKTAGYAAMLAWQLGVHPDDLAGIDFRHKIPGRKANEKGIVVTAKDGTVRGPETVQNLFGANYNLGFFQFEACNYCDDVVAETADISVGDAWLPEDIADGRGTSILIVRNRELDAIVRQGLAEKRLSLRTLSEKEAVRSQAGGFRQRRDGLAYRLHLDARQGKQFAPKRVEPSEKHIGWKRKRIYRHRMKMAELSHAAFARALQENDFQVFKSVMEPFVRQNERLNSESFIACKIRRATERIGRMVAKHAH